MSEKNCLGCQLVGGTSLAGISLFLQSQIKHQQNKFAKVSIGLVSVSVGLLSVAKFLDFSPVKKSS